jgi:hypothetical protein
MAPVKRLRKVKLHAGEDVGLSLEVFNSGYQIVTLSSRRDILITFGLESVKQRRELGEEFIMAGKSLIIGRGKKLKEKKVS